MMRRLALIAVLLLALSMAALWLIGDRLSRPASGVVGAPPASLQGAQSLRLPTDAGLSVAGWFAPGRPGAGAVLLMHGLRADRRSMLGRALFLQRQGFAVLLIDLPAHGESGGERIGYGRHEGAGLRAALRFLAERLPRERVGVIGCSLGAATVVLNKRPSSSPALSAVVLESMYPSIAEAVADRLALHLGAWARPAAPLLLAQLPWRLGISAEQLRPIDHIGALGSPLLLLAGDLDRHTRLSETQRLFAAAAAPKSLWIVPGAAHVDLHAFDAPGYEARVGAFLREQLRPATAVALSASSGRPETPR